MPWQTSVALSAIERLQHWYASQCDGDWEHDQGIHIETLDNPGWSVAINLEGTALSAKDFADVQIERNSKDWLHIFIRDNKYMIRCGPLNLEEGLNEFFGWVDKS